MREIDLSKIIHLSESEEILNFFGKVASSLPLKIYGPDENYLIFTSYAKRMESDPDIIDSPLSIYAELNKIEGEFDYKIKNPDFERYEISCVSKLKYSNPFLKILDNNFRTELRIYLNPINPGDLHLYRLRHSNKSF